VTIQEFQARCLSNAQRLGWNDREVPIPEMIALIHSEVSEALEAFRDPSQPLSWVDDHGKPQGVASEFADIMIRVGHYAEKLGINLTEEIDKKLTYNLTRGYRHGGKLA
jgi:NTP pyrophosphatase (non-canonical NTP hydrolase)